ncbi:MAG: fatty acid desaturase, partial [Acidimicrobiales bacterium]
VTTVWLHRTLAHRAVSLVPGVTWFLRVVTWLTTGIRPRQWVAVHRRHHAHTDVEGDPHSPVLLGFGAVQLGNVLLYRRAAADTGSVERYSRDLPPDRWDRMLFDHAVLGLGIGIVALCTLFGLWLGLLAAVVHAVAYLMLSSAVNAVGHTFGSRPHDNLAANSQWLAWITAGEGLHNNHHAAPTSARLAMAPGQFDPGWWVISALRRMRWATVRSTRPVTARRPGRVGRVALLGRSVSRPSPQGRRPQTEQRLLDALDVAVDHDAPGAAIAAVETAPRA